MGKRNEIVFSLLKNQNKTKAAMANALGISRSALTQWEKNNTDPTFEQCITLAQFFNVPVSYIYSEANNNWQPEFVDKDEKSLDKRVEKLLDAVNFDADLLLDGEVMDKAAREIFTMNVKNALLTAKLAAKIK